MSGAQAGKDILVKVDSDGSGTMQTIGGLRTKSMTLDRETIDVTNSDSAGLWRELLSGGSVGSMSVSASGVFKDEDADATCVSYQMAGTIRDWQVIVPDFGTFEGLFQITSLEFAGEHSGEATKSLSLESAGAITFTAES